VPVALTPPQQQALHAAQEWVKTQEEAQRRSAFTASQTATLDNAAGCAALAAFWSGGSMAPEEAPVVPPADHLCHHAAACSVILAGVTQPEKINSHYQTFIEIGKDIMAGKRPY
jgi:hypothetical protein